MDEGTPEKVDWRTTYRGLDTGALLALLPLLDVAYERAKGEVELLERTLADSEKNADLTTEHLQHAMTLQEQGVDVSKYVSEAEELADSFTANATNGQKYLRAMFAYASDLVTRREWILRDEAYRRGLLPDPAEFLPRELRRPYA
ncbi:hypothetical protein G7043_41255 [Lentzea sp. NEAU-D13]|uniref:Uncharacterized protein n=1 Tax=Lentzea alba TaxID=2714351 RepID=A0A7C9W471_9PSEU|nr:hypothetical protein [Lentzea alba]NGY65341.1 hypothetical protein [Lentzea alba]